MECSHYGRQTQYLQITASIKWSKSWNLYRTQSASLCSPYSTNQPVGDRWSGGEVKRTYRQWNVWIFMSGYCKCSDSEGPHLIDCGALRCFFFFPHGSFWFTLHFSLAGFSPGPHSALHAAHSSFGCLMTPWWNSAADHTTTLRLNRNWRWRRGDEILLDISQLLRNAQRSHGLSS